MNKKLEVTIAQRGKDIRFTLPNKSDFDYTYTGKPIEPPVTVEWKDSKGNYNTISKEEYEIKYSDNTDAGENSATVTISDKESGNFKVNGSKTFTITKAVGSITPPTEKDLTYTGKAQDLINKGSSETGEIQYSLDNTTFDTKIPQETNANENGYTVYFKVVGDKNHEDVKTSSIKVPIAPMAITIAPDDIVLSKESNYIYTGKVIEPGVTSVIYGNETFKEGDDYTVSYENNTKVGTEAIVKINDVKGGNYEISGSKKFEILPAPSVVTTPPTAKSNTYNGTAQELLNKDGKTSTGTLEYSLSQDQTTFSTTIPKETNAGTYQVYYRVKGDENHSDSEPVPVSATIAQRGKDIRFTLPNKSDFDYTYTGKPIEPPVTVEWKDSKGNYNTISKEEYEIKYSDNTDAGENSATVTISDKESGNFKVNGSKTFTITKAAGSITPPTEKDLTYTGKAQDLINKGSSETGEIQYSLDNTTFDTKIPQETNANENGYTVYFKVVGDKNHEDVKTSSIKVPIAPKPITIAPDDIVLKKESNYTYTGKTIEPEVTSVKYENETFTKGVDYTVSYANNTKVGIAIVNINDVKGGNYIIRGSKTFEITRAASSLTKDPTVKTGIVYNGTDQALINAGTSSTGKVQYRLGEEGEFGETIPTGKNAGTYQVYYRVKGDDNHGDSEISDPPLEVTIAPKELTSKEIVITLSQDTYTYTGEKIEPGVTVKYGDTEFTKDKDFTVSYENNINVGTNEAKPTVTIKDKDGGNYVINGSKTFTIAKADVSLANFEVTPTRKENLVFNGTAESFAGTAQALINAGTLKEPLPGTLEYSLDGKTYSEEIPTGTDVKTYKVYYRVKGDNNHNNFVISEPFEVTIAPKELTSKEIVITLSQDTYPYTGSDIKPEVSVKFGKTEFTKDKDYTVSYSNNKNVGTEAAQPTVTITDKDGGNYIVSGSKTFEITRAASSLTKAPTVRTGIIYSGTDQALINAGTSNTGKVQYSLSKDEKSFSETIPTGKNAGDYTVYYRVKGDANHSDSEIGSVKATIAAKEITSFSLSQSSYTYTGSEIKPDVIVEFNKQAVSKDEYTVSYSSNKDAGTATVTVTDKEGGNFTVSGSKTFTIAKAPLTISADSYDIFEGEKIPVFTVRYDGFVNNETEAVLTAKPVLSCNATATSKPGDYTISVGGSKATNYDITHKSGKLTIIAMKFVSGGESSKDEDDPATYQITSTGKDVGTTPTVAIVDDKEVGGAFAIPEAVTYHNTNYKVTEINESAFENNKYLTNVTIPSSITTIGDKAFKGCSNLKSITVYITTPISLAVAGTRGSDGASVFEGVDKTTCVLYVPDGSVDLYKAAPVWCEFKHIVPISTLTGISGVNATEGEPFDIYNLQGRKVKSKAYDLKGLPRGIYIINGKKVAVK